MLNVAPNNFSCKQMVTCPCYLPFGSSGEKKSNRTLVILYCLLESVFPKILSIAKKQKLYSLLIEHRGRSLNKGSISLGNKATLYSFIYFLHHSTICLPICLPVSNFVQTSILLTLNEFYGRWKLIILKNLLSIQVTIKNYESLHFISQFLRERSTTVQQDIFTFGLVIDSQENGVN